MVAEVQRMLANVRFAPEAEVPATSEDQPGDAGGMNARQATRKQTSSGLPVQHPLLSLHGTGRE